MERRQFIETATLAGGLMAMGGITQAFADEGKAEKAHSDKWTIQDKGLLEKVSAVRNSLFECANSGQVCAEHCQEQLTSGDKHFGDCAAAVSQMLAVCEGTAKLASMKAIRLKETLGACISTCQACKDACDEHSAHWKHGMHLACKDCSEACGKAITSLKLLQESFA